MAWREVWQRPGLLLLAFWNVIITSLVELFFMSRLGPQVLPIVSQANSAGFGIGQLGSISPQLGTKLALVYLTMLFIVIPFTLGGLYGGVSAALARGDRLVGFFRFFRFAIDNFWRSLAMMVGLLAMAVAVGIFLGAINLGLSTFAGNSPVGVAAGVVALALTLLTVVLTMATLLYWLGAVYYGHSGVREGLGEAVRWIRRDWWLGIRLVFTVLGLLIIPGILVNLLGTFIPVLGGLFSLVAGGLVMATLATLAAVLNRESNRHQILPPV